jgi:hypothetical protein
LAFELGKWRDFRGYEAPSIPGMMKREKAYIYVKGAFKIYLQSFFAKLKSFSPLAVVSTKEL